MPLVAAIALVVWIVVLGFVPDPRPLGAPESAVRGIRALLSVSEPTARAAATIAFRGAGVGLIGVLLAVALRSMRRELAAPLLLVLSPLLAVGAKSFNFGYLPLPFQLGFILAAAVLGALAGLALLRSRIAIAGLGFGVVALSAWGLPTRVTDDLYEAAGMTGRHLLDIAPDVPPGDSGFSQLMRRAFAYAEDNSHGTDAVLPNQAAILALGVILGEERVARVARREIDAGRRPEWVALRRRIRLHGRRDLSQHFWVSAALVVLSDAQRSLTVGITKEMKDSTPGGSGFSFVDMAANKAGIRFAVAATRNAASARAVQLRTADGVDLQDCFPAMVHLPEGLSRDAFKSRFGGVGSAETRAVFQKIDRRLATCEALR